MVNGVLGHEQMKVAMANGAFAHSARSVSTLEHAELYARRYFEPSPESGRGFVKGQGDKARNSLLRSE